MDDETRYSADSDADIARQIDWLDESKFSDIPSAQSHLRQVIEAIRVRSTAPSGDHCEAPPSGEVDDIHPLTFLRDAIVPLAGFIADPDRTLRLTCRFIAGAEDPQGLVSLFRREPGSLSSLVQLFGTNPGLAERLISDPTTFHLVTASHHRSYDRSELIGELLGQLKLIDQPTRAALAIRKFLSRHVMRIAYGEFVRGDTPDIVGRQLAHLGDAIIEGGLQFALRRLADRRGMPERADGSVPQVTVIGLGNFGGEELSYSSPMKVVFLYDAIDHKNIWHSRFFAALVDDVVGLLCGDASRRDGVDLDLRDGPRHEVGVRICGYREAARIYETSGRTWQRLGFVKARVVAGSTSLGKAFLERMEPWVYRRFVSRVERSEIEMLRHKLQRRADSPLAPTGLEEDVVRASGGRSDLELTIQFLQLIHGGHDRSVRSRNTLDAINGLHRGGHISDKDQARLAGNYAKLCRLQHQINIAFDRGSSMIPADPSDRRMLAYQLGIRDDDCDNRSGGDAAKFERIFAETLAKNRSLMKRVLADSSNDATDTSAETDLMLDPDPDPDLVDRTLRQYQLQHPRSAMRDLASLCTETVPFLSPLRCRHVFSSIAPKLLAEVSRTPDPDAALHSLVRVTDSLGAKATLWELLGGSDATMQLVVRLCATTPYLSGLLTDNPGMIDELIDSLVINRLPSAQRLDAHSIELCRGAADIDDILRSFKSGAHLMIGVRDMLGKETLEATHQAIGDCAEACLRRVIEHEQEFFADQFGDPVDADGQPSEMVTLGLGKLGGREPNYQSDLDAIFLYSADGETQRRVGGRRSTTTNRRFFNQVARQVVARINSPHSQGRLYELDSRLRPIDEPGPIAISVDEFLEQFQSDAAPLWMRMALCQARAISGDRRTRAAVDEAVASAIAATRWDPSMATQIRQMRMDLEKTADPKNLKRAAGGTQDAEFVAHMLTLKHAHDVPEIIRHGTTASLRALADAGLLSGKDADALTDGYRTLRRIEASLRLMLAPDRHALPDDADLMKRLAFLMGQTDPTAIEDRCTAARKSNRDIFNRVFANV
ncbi:Glutamate-ammonia-ligase adenylyltransferase [Rubripirellula lacrimiformis]|uniref:Glutamate-ammonia-ligase adenylyltransferase n=1 Tax=Rubripirellula lacrimiformis TaxID=1930273 RepID=A0A517NH46_9BACT|nr:glutamate-ammonia-ligase adenylyltransferase [Rubripirellula lacrimiformis]QDT06408.1 Glutamate-ammonia-ligase adenylyltransferase [Rubripirellula lacrimiformis]